MFKLLKFTSNRKFIFLFIFIQWIFFIGISVIGLLVNPDLGTQKYIIFSAAFALNVILLPSAIKKVKKEGKSYLSIPIQLVKNMWHEDVFYFRIQYYVGTMLLDSSWTLLILLMGIAESRNLVFSSLYFLEFLLFFHQIGMILLITILEKFLNFFRKPTLNYSNTIQIMMDDPELYSIFYNFAKNEFSMENIEYYKDIQKYETFFNFQERKELANELLNLYFNGFESNLEVNIDGLSLKLMKLQYKTISTMKIYSVLPKEKFLNDTIQEWSFLMNI
eukprot:gene4474-7855_t